MKRFNKTAVALATAGAMTLAIVPNASAQEDSRMPGVKIDRSEDSVEGAPSFGPDGTLVNPGNPSIGEAGADKELETIEGGDPENGQTGTPSEGDDQNLPPRPTPLGNGEPIEENQDAFQPIPVTLNKGDKIVDFAGKVQHTAQADGEFATLEPGDRVIRAGKDVTGQLTAAAGVASAATPVTLKWGDVIVDKDGRIVWSAKTNGEYAVLQEGDKVVPAGRIGVGVLAALTSATLAGVIYNVVKNSKGEPVLVPADRADQTPTAEDEAKTKELVANNAEELAAQAAAQNGGAEARTVDNADRGVGAATGNNTIAKGLVGLLIASIMGAAVFAFGRRRLV